jgi:AraC family transcriptional regulator, regulatory protein of adaptative response / methylated-DNA-[protein]-cysteine methyltransferase
MRSHSGPDGGPSLVAKRLTTPLGPMVAVATEGGLCMLEFAGPRQAAQTRRIRERFGLPLVRGTNRHLARLERELRAYFAGTLRAFRVPLRLEGTPFQLGVWRLLLRIPFGSVTSYDALARQLKRRGAQRAVGRANGDNPLAIVVPCHRVVGRDGGLCGYGGGLWRKRRLLELERAPRAAR